MNTTFGILFLVATFTLISQCESGEIIDLTWDFNNDTIYWPTIAPFTYTKKVGNDNERGYWYAVNEFCAAEHGGTHFDAPYHFNKEGWKVGDIPLRRLVAKGALIDLNGKNLLQPQDLTEWEKVNGQFENNTVLLLKFHWSHLWTNRTAYLGITHDGSMSFPGVSAEAANWIVQSNKIVGVGLDTSSVDPGSSTDYMSHRILSKNQIYGLENVKLLAELPVKGFTLIVSPMKIQDGTGAPLRLLAIIE